MEGVVDCAAAGKERERGWEREGERGERERERVGERGGERGEREREREREREVNILLVASAT